MPVGPIVTRHEGMAAVRHLFRVCSGLDSQILGEAEVLGQVRRAYDAARAAGTTTREMDLISLRHCRPVGGFAERPCWVAIRRR